MYPQMQQQPTGIPPDVMARFRQIDTDGSGSISPAELGTALSPQKPIPIQHIKLLIRSCTNSARVGPTEFWEIDKFVYQIFMVFRKYDADNSGTIDRKEIIPAIQSLGFRINESTLMAIMGTFDIDRSGALSYSEFIGVCALCKLAFNLFNAWSQGKPSFSMNYESLLCASLWFL